jgi:hypothetical protein
MNQPTLPEEQKMLPLAARALGLAGLIPQLLVVAALVMVTELVLVDRQRRAPSLTSSPPAVSV